MGFYPVCPGTDEYILGSPKFKKVTLNLENGNKVEITAANNDKTKRYIGSMSVNGTNYTKNYLTHETLLSGARIDYQMTQIPNKERGIMKQDMPYSMSTEVKK